MRELFIKESYRFLEHLGASFAAVQVMVESVEFDVSHLLAGLLERVSHGAGFVDADVLVFGSVEQKHRRGNRIDALQR